MNLSSWILSITGIVVLTLIVDILLPEGQTAKYIKSIFAVITVFVIVFPLPKLFSEGISFDKQFESDGAAHVDETYLENLGAYRADYIENLIVSELEGKKISGVEIEVFYQMKDYVFEIKTISVNLDKASFEGQGTNIDVKEEILDVIENALNVSNDKVVFYE